MCFTSIVFGEEGPPEDKIGMKVQDIIKSKRPQNKIKYNQAQEEISFKVKELAKKNQSKMSRQNIGSIMPRPLQKNQN